MFRKLFLKYKQKHCLHDFHSLDDEQYIGECLSWGLRVVNEFQCTYECKKCGKREVRRGIHRVRPIMRTN